MKEKGEKKKRGLNGGVAPRETAQEMNFSNEISKEIVKQLNPEKRRKSVMQSVTLF